ncbi:MAG: tetratricopeptide repeat protein [Ignavibacteriales bacterium]|nr:tetratricopeptide repeat protein [Ignavibacteriales bacterium]
MPDPVLHDLLSEGIDLTLCRRYVSADSLFKIVSNRFPDHPAGYLYQAAVIEARSIDHISQPHRGPFDSLLEVASNFSERMIAEQPDSPWGYYFLATALGYDAFARADRGDWFGGLRKGLSSVSQFKTCVEKDTLFYDAFAGLGTYYYWTSRKTEFINWLPFVSDDRDEGIRMLRQCAKLGTYNRFVALSSLVTIFLDAGKPQQAGEVAREALSQYPMNRVFLWGLGDALWKSGKHKEAEEVYVDLLASINSDALANPYSEVLCRLNIVRMKMALQDSTDVDFHLRSLLAFESHVFPEELQARAKAKFDEARRIQSLLKNNRNSGN